jgi:hypothetical protein
VLGHPLEGAGLEFAEVLEERWPVAASNTHETQPGLDAGIAQCVEAAGAAEPLIVKFAEREI